MATQLAKDGDIHVITGLLKLYLRELPESLFTDTLYPNLVTGMGTVCSVVSVLHGMAVLFESCVETVKNSPASTNALSQRCQSANSQSGLF